MTCGESSTPETPDSRTLYERARKVLPGGPATARGANALQLSLSFGMPAESQTVGPRTPHRLAVVTKQDDVELATVTAPNIAIS
jgi:hypothetical protein